MSFSEKFIRTFKSFLPAPFTIAVILTLVTFGVAFFWGSNYSNSSNSTILSIALDWEKGLWNKGLMVFAMQMMLMLVLGHTLALTPLADKVISKLTKFCNTSANSAFIVTFFTLLVSFFNWGLGLIFGAILARKVGEHALKNNVSINYPLIGAAGYSGLMVWHGGLSGSAPIKVAEPGHFLESKIGTISQTETVFSSMNIFVSIALLVIIPGAMYLVGKKTEQSPPKFEKNNGSSNTNIHLATGAEKLDYSKYFGTTIGVIILGFIIYKTFIFPEDISLKVITPNFINLLLLGLALTLHQSFSNFLKAIENAIGGASGILIQFPLYFGIMGIINGSGLIVLFSDFFSSVSTETTFPIFTFLSAGIVNVFVPSGGGQWAVQGPIIIEAANNLNVSISKSIMALAYGDQITNMLQPFWALPLLGITKLKASEILPYTLLLMIIGSSIFIGGLLVF